MATVNIQNAELRNGEQFDLWVYQNSGKLRLALNVSVDSNGKTTVTWSKSDKSIVEFVEATGE